MSDLTGWATTATNFCDGLSPVLEDVSATLGA